MELLTAVEAFTQVITYVMIAAGVPPVLSMLRTGDTRPVPYPFFLAGIINSVMACYYGILVNNSTILQINVIATGFNIFYILSFIYSSRIKSSPALQFLVCVGVISSIYVYVTYVARAESRMDDVGVICLTCTTLLQSSPLLQVRKCVHQQSGASISMVMMVAGFLCCGAWATYGYLLHDFYIYAPNLLGLFTYLCQLITKVVYGTRAVKSHVH